MSIWEKMSRRKNSFVGNRQMKHQLFAIIILAVLCVGSEKASAQNSETEFNRYINSCLHTSSTLDSKICLHQQYKLADAELNRVWKRVLTMIATRGLPPKVRKAWKSKLVTAQRYWVKFKTAECDGSVPYKYWQGTLAGVVSLHCLLQVTITRTLELQNYLEEG